MKNKSIYFDILFIILFANICVAMKIEQTLFVPNKIISDYAKEGNDNIARISEEAKKNRDFGGRIQVVCQNTGNHSVRLDDIAICGNDLKSLKSKYEIIWYRSEPELIQPGKSCIITIVLRTSMFRKGELKLKFSDECELKSKIVESDKYLKLEGIRFNDGLKNIYVYGRRMHSSVPDPKYVILNGKKYDNAEFVCNVLENDFFVCRIRLKSPLTKGEDVNLIFYDGDRLLGAGAIRAFENLDIWGTYGGYDFLRFARNKLSGLNSFGHLSKSLLDEMGELGIRGVSKSPVQREEKSNHESLYAYLLKDEPDNHDYSFKNIPLSKRIGSSAPSLLKLIRSNLDLNGKIPSLLTIDCTFIPFNYYVYGGLADITNPDIYTQALGWSIKKIDQNLRIARDACSPKVMTFTLGSCFEEFTDYRGPWVSRDQILKKGFDFYRSKHRIRGLGRAPTPDEIRLAVFYALSNGATGLFAFWDTTGIGADLLFHGTEDMPLQWKALGDTYHVFRYVSSLIGIANPVNWAVTTQNKVKVSTLLAGDKAVLILVINENFKEGKKGFRFQPMNGVDISISRKAFLDVMCVYRVTERGIERHPYDLYDSELKFKCDLKGCELFILGRNPQEIKAIIQENSDVLSKQQECVLKLERKIKKEQAEIDYVKKIVKDKKIDVRQLKSEASKGCYMIHGKDFSDKQERYNAFEFYEERGNTPVKIICNIHIDEKDLNKKMAILWKGKFGGNEIVQKLIFVQDGSVCKQERLKAYELKDRVFVFLPVKAGDYQFVLEQKFSIKRTRMVQVSRHMKQVIGL